MKHNPFGLHVMDNNVPDGEMWAYLAAARPATTVILNNHFRAQQVKASYPQMIVVHRQYHANDPKWHTLITAEAWVEANRPFGSNGVVVACLNEPGGDFRYDVPYREHFIDWLIAVMDAAKIARIKLALPNWSVGNPHESTIENGGFDRLLRRVAAAGDAVYWSCHEYWHDDPVAEHPFTIGRNEFWSDRVAELGLPPLNLLLTEYGMDTGGGGGDGWRNQGISDEAYADQFKASRTVLANKPPGAIYGFGEGFGWGSFNIAGTGVPARLQSYQEDIPMAHVDPPTEGGVPSKLTKVPGTWVNIRSEPVTTSDGVDVGDLFPGDQVIRYPEINGWVYIEPTTTTPHPAGNQSAAKGWVSLQNGGVVFTDVVVIPPPEETYILTKDQYQRLAGVKVQIGAQLQTLDQVRIELVSAQTEIAKILQEVVPADDGSSFPA